MFRLEISEPAHVRSVICTDSTKRLTGLYEGVLTGKGLTYGGSLARTGGNWLRTSVSDP